jgi:ABC-type nitrate/sulfonate/bicarbonate transport system permease component
MVTVAKPILAVLFLIFIWELIVWSGWIAPEYFPGPVAVAHAFSDLIASGEIIPAVLVTFARSLLGLCGSVALGLGLAIIGTQVPIIGRAFSPIADLFRALPPAAITPISIFFLGLGWQLYAFIMLFACFWPVYLNAQAALNAVSREQLATARVFGYDGWTRLSLVQIPAALPDAFVGIRLAASISLIAAIVAEMLAGRDGLGFLMSDAAFTLRIPDTFVCLVAAMLLGLVMNSIVLVARRVAIGWHDQMNALNRR